MLGFWILINDFDRLNLSAAHPALTKDFGINGVEYGYLRGGFLWTYAILQIPVGIVLARYGVVTVGRVGAFSIYLLSQAKAWVDSGSHRAEG